MNRLLRLAAPLLLAIAASGCSISSLLGGGGKIPPTLLTLTPEAAAPGEFARSAAAGEAVTISVPVIPEELRTVRVPAQITPTDIAYIQDVRWVDTPNRLFQDLVAETVRRTTGRVVLDPKQVLDPGLVVSGNLRRFGFDVTQQAAIVQYDATLSTLGGTRVETRRFEARVPAAGERNVIGPALNRAANEVAMEVARWIGG
jgi:cholesterol transport system auxiliary component